MDKFISKKELKKEHQTEVDLKKLSQVMKAKNPKEMKEIMNQTSEKIELSENQKKEKSIIDDLFKKLEKGEELSPNEKIIRGSFKTHWIYRPAPVQKDIFSKDFAYKQKDEEYNIW